ncbi:MAG: translation initiation factor eIF-1A [Methanotrichaceae archaeon]|nr:translation initiation factor eIF-1A [Methanotrichaceae archaeon]
MCVLVPEDSIDLLSITIRGDTLYKRDNEEEGAVITRVRLPRKQDREMFGHVESLLGSNRIKVRGLDGITRMARIPGKMKKRIWIREGDVVIIIPWEFQNDKADVVWRYTGPQVDWLQRKGFLKGTA